MLKILFKRMIGVFLLKVDTFEEIEADTKANGQAFIVVTLAALLISAGVGLTAILFGQNFRFAFLNALLWTYLGWLLWSGLTYFVGTRFFKGLATPGEMLRVLGFAHAPLMIGFIPVLGAFFGMCWTLLAAFVAIRQGLDTDDLRALLTIAVGFLPYLFMVIVVKLLLGNLM